MHTLIPPRTHPPTPIPPPKQVVAEKLLLSAALTNPLNQRFMLLSDACVPVQPAPLVYTALILRSTSSVNACSRGESDEDERNIWRCVGGLGGVGDVCEGGERVVGVFRWLCLEG